MDLLTCANVIFFSPVLSAFTFFFDLDLDLDLEWDFLIPSFATIKVQSWCKPSSLLTTISVKNFSDEGTIWCILDSLLWTRRPRCLDLLIPKRWEEFNWGIEYWLSAECWPWVVTDLKLFLIGIFLGFNVFKKDYDWLDSDCREYGLLISGRSYEV